MAGSPFCTSSAYPLGAYRIPLGTGLLIPSQKMGFSKTVTFMSRPVKIFGMRWLRA
jgi:hypothetical protein